MGMRWERPRLTLVIGSLLVWFLGGTLSALAKAPTDVFVEKFESTYLDEGQRDEAMTSLRNYLGLEHNPFTSEQRDAILEIVLEYYTYVAGAKASDFKDVVLGLFYEQPQKYNDEIVSFFQNKQADKLYRWASDVRSAYYSPSRMTVEMKVRTIQEGDRVPFSVRGWNRYDIELALTGENYIVLIEDESYARIRGVGTVEGIREGTTKLVITDNAAVELASLILDITEIPLVILEFDPASLKLDALSSSIVTLVASGSPIGDLERTYEFSEEGYAEMDLLGYGRGSFKQELRITAIKPIRDLVLTAYGPGGINAVTTIRIDPLEPVEPSKKWAWVTSGVSAGFLTLAYMKKGEGDDLRAEAGNTSDTSLNASLNTEADDAYSASSLYATLGGLSLAGATYLWYRWFKANSEYKEKKTFYDSWSMSLTPRGGVQFALKF